MHARTRTKVHTHTHTHTCKATRRSAFCCPAVNNLARPVTPGATCSSLSLCHPSCQLDNEPQPEPTLNPSMYMPFPCYPFSPLRFRGGPSKKHFVELSAYLIKCNMDMSWLTCLLTYCAMSSPPPATRPPSPWPSLAPCPLAHGARRLPFHVLRSACVAIKCQIWHKQVFT